MVINPPRGIVTVPAIMALTGGYKVLINLLMLWLMESGIGAYAATIILRFGSTTGSASHFITRVAKIETPPQCFVIEVFFPSSPVAFVHSHPFSPTSVTFSPQN